MKKNTTFYCFSPPVMIATFAIELTLFLYVFVRYRMSPVGRIISALLILLATFQYAEFNVCQSIGAAGLYSRIGYSAITMLPPVGLHLASKISGKGSKKLVGGAYATGIMFALAIGLSPSAFNSYACAGNYAVFHLNDQIQILYSAYYYGLLFMGIAFCLKHRKTASKKISEALTLQALGYISFMLPTGIINMINPSTIAGIPSIMCGFAVIYALILTFGIAPRVLQEKPLPKVLSIR